MVKNYNELAARFTVDFINTYDPLAMPVEKLNTPADVIDLLRAHDLTPNLQPPDQIDLMRLREVRTQLWEAFASRDTRISVAITNDLLRHTYQMSRLEILNGRIQMLFFTPPEVDLTQQVITEAVLGMSAALKDYGKSRLKACDASPCQQVFIDTSKNGLRRFCGDRCANRYNVAQFRQRQKGEL